MYACMCLEVDKAATQSSRAIHMHFDARSFALSRYQYLAEAFTQNFMLIF